MAVQASTLTTKSIHAAQFIGCPLYLLKNKNYYYAWMASTKQFFGILATTVMKWFSPTTIRMSSDAEIADEFEMSNGVLETHFPERIILMANHQIYTDWLYLWWFSYCNRMHGHIYIILKESLKYWPVIGPGMRFYSFIFLARKWDKDKPRFQHRLEKLNSRHTGPLSGTGKLDPMWLLMFPEGTNLSDNGRRASSKWAAKSGISDLDHQLLPRSTGLHFCLQELRGTVEWIYDCTVAYEGIPRGAYGQDIFTLRTLFFQGKRVPSVNMYWRRFHIPSIPIDDAKEFDVWLRDRWFEKDELLEQFRETGRFPGFPKTEKGQKNGEFIETEAHQRRPWEFLTIYIPLATVLGFWYFLIKRPFS